MQRVQKLLAKVLLITTIAYSFFSTLLANVVTAGKLTPDQDQYIELKVIDTNIIQGTGKQVVAELWAYNLDFGTIDLELGFDEDNFKIYDLNTEKVVEIAEYNHNMQILYPEAPFIESDFYIFADYTNEYINYIFTLDTLILNNNNPHIIKNSNDEILITSDGNGLKLGTISFVIVDGNVSNQTFISQEIRVITSLTDYYSDPSVFRFTAYSSDADLTDIKIDSESVENFDKDILTYEKELTEEKQNVDLLPVLSNNTAGIVVRTKKEDADNPGQFIYDVISQDETELNYEVPLQNLRNRHFDRNYCNSGRWYYYKNIYINNDYSKWEFDRSGINEY